MANRRLLRSSTLQTIQGHMRKLDTKALYASIFPSQSALGTPLKEGFLLHTQPSLFFTTQI